jgi:hypothetical protein
MDTIALYSHRCDNLKSNTLSQDGLQYPEELIEKHIFRLWYSGVVL